MFVAVVENGRGEGIRRCWGLKDLSSNGLSLSHSDYDFLVAFLQ